MNDQQPFPKDALKLHPLVPSRSRLTKLAIILAITAAVTFGLCSVSLGKHGEETTYKIIGISFLVEIICVGGLFAIGLMAIVRAARKKSL